MACTAYKIQKGYQAGQYPGEVLIHGDQLRHKSHNVEYKQIESL